MREGDGACLLCLGTAACQILIIRRRKEREGLAS
jgi:hypothetical protein